jgi:S-adenosylmethionine-diacylglycerol 3-amino-3-carboxypropyl transferase
MSDAIEQRAKLDFIRYASVWEDADILYEALNAKAGGRILSIASGGDNAFALLTGGAEVIAVDLNPTQLAVVELKKVAMAALDYEELLGFLGVNPMALRLATYQKLKGQLSPGARSFFDQHCDVVKLGVIHAGKFERYFQLFRKRILPLVHGQEKTVRLLDKKTLSEQKIFYERRWDTWRWRALFRVFFSRWVMGRLGRDPEFFKYVEGKVSDRILARTQYALSELSTSTNPYLRYIISGNFSKEALPRYLRREQVEVIRPQLQNLQLVEGAIDQVAVEQGGDFTGYNLSDIFEYLDEETGHEIYATLVDCAVQGARLAYWNMLVPRQCPEGMIGRVKRLDVVSDELYLRDRAWFYSAFHVDEVSAG